MPDIKQDAVIARTIAADQRAVAEMWADTFIHNNSPDDIATRMMQMLLSSIAVGDFQTRTSEPDESGSSTSALPELQPPNVVLTNADYLSHASRIILDYQSLSEPNKAKLLGYFKISDNKVTSRTSTHTVSRENKDSKGIEGKNILHGFTGLWSKYMGTPHNFGINIAMGGEGKDNFYGNKITANGYSGHVFFYHDNDGCLLLMGLEQTEPATSLFSQQEQTTGSNIDSNHHVQHGSDQFGQQHSSSGQSDTYTAAGSLYFSDPIYRMKLLVEKQCLPPNKYNGMYVTINDDHWSAIEWYVKELQQLASQEPRAVLVNKLLEKPKTASSAQNRLIGDIKVNYREYLTRIYTHFMTPRTDFTSKQQEEIERYHKDLSNYLDTLEVGGFSLHYQNVFLSRITTAAATSNTALAQAYKDALLPVSQLLQLQHITDPEFQNTAGESLYEQYENLQSTCNKLVQDLKARSQHITEYCTAYDPIINAYLKNLHRLLHHYSTLPCISTSSDKELHTSDDSPMLSLGCGDIVHLSPPSSLSVTALETWKTTAEQLFKNQPQLCSVTTLENREKQLEKKKIQVVRQLKSEIHTLEQTVTRLEQHNQATSRRATRQINIAKILVNIEEMKKQAEHLQDYPQAHTEASDLIKKLERAVEAYLSDSESDETIPLDCFKQQCEEYLREPRKALCKEEAFKTIILNMLLAIALLGVGYIAATAVKKHRTGQYLFFTTTNAGNKVNHMDRSLSELSIVVAQDTPDTSPRSP